MREHAGSSFVLSLLIVAGFAILLFPDEKGLQASASDAAPATTGSIARATPATPLPPPPPLPAQRPSLARPLPKPIDADADALPAAVAGAPAVVSPRRAVAEAEPIQPRATFTAASRPVPALINEDDVPRLEPIDLPELRPEPVRRRVNGSWQAGPASRAR